LTYTYAYKTPDGIRHEATMEAPSREAVFSALRGRGIRPIKVVAADGAKANGELRGVRKRVVAALVGVALAVVVALFFNISEKKAEISTLNSRLATAPTAPRHQIYGDPAIVGAFEAGAFEPFLSQPGDRRLAWFAQPGKIMSPKGLSSAALQRLGPREAAELEAVRASDAPVASDDPREVRELKQIVNGMRAEMCAYLANGNGTVRSYWRRLLERTRQEAQIYERTKLELARESDAAVWDEKNEALRRLGLRTIPNPKDAE